MMTPLNFLKLLLRDKQKLFFALVFFYVMGMLFDLFLPFLFKILLDESLAYVSGNKEVFKTILFYSFLLIIVANISRFSFRIFDYFEAKFTPKVNAEIPLMVFKYISNHSVSFFNNNFSGEIVQKIKQINDISKYLLVSYPTNFLATIITLIVTIGLILPKSVLLAVSIIIFGAVYFMLSYLLATKNKLLSSKWANKNSKFNGHLIDSVENMILIKSFSKKDDEFKNLNGFATEEEKALFNLKMNMTKIKLFHTLISSGMIVFVTFYSLYLYLHELISIGDFVFNYTVISRLTNQFYMIGEMTSELVEKYGIFDSSIKFIYKEQDGDYKLPDIKIVEPKINFENISFKYTNEYVFKNFNLKINSLEKVAIVGASGSGKSTLIKLLLKQYNVEGGSLLIDNQDIKNYNMDSINNQITYVNQDVYLFNRSIRENITYIKPNATEDELIEACNKAGCLDFILEKKNGFNTVVGERGVQLSGGEKQRLALARAFLINKPILILDEPTSALDSLSETIIQKSLIDLMENKTVIIVAHRLSTIKNMDRIIVLESGQVIEDGKHADLLELGGKYKDLWSNQMY